MKVLIDDKEQNTPEKSTATVNDIDKLLSNYTEALNVETESGDDSHKSDIEEPTLNLDDKSDPKLYYQSGKKKGQRKPSADKYLKASISKKPGADDSTATIGGEIISGMLFLTLIDLLFPLLIATVNNQFSKSKIDANKLRLTATQRKELAPICDEVAKQFQITANPMTLLITSLAGIYGMNFYMLKMED